MSDGASGTTLEGQSLSIQKRNERIAPSEKYLEKAQFKRQNKAKSDVECPKDVDCKWSEAYYGSNGGNVADYGNYAKADRTKENIKYIVIHDTEGSYDSAISWFKNPASYASAHYVIRSSDGRITQMVKDKDIAWHAGNWYMNSQSIGIEHEGYAADGATWYTESMYRSSAKLVKYLAAKYDIPLTPERILGHDQYMGASQSGTTNMHWDPGPYWDWEHYYALIGIKNEKKNDKHGTIAVVNPSFATNRPVVTVNNNGQVETLPAQGANFVYVRTAPSETAPLVTDAALHPGGEPGTTRIDDWSAKTSYGKRYSIIERRPQWTSIWFNGQKGWIKNTDYTQVRSDPRLSKKASYIVTPKPGSQTIPIYGAAYPESSAYPSTLNDRGVQTPLQYVASQGQQYVASGEPIRSSYYYTWTIDSSVPDDNRFFYGNDTFIQISYNHRQAYVKTSDVVVVPR